FLLVCFVRGCVRIFLGISPNMPHFPSLPRTNPLAQKQELSTFQCSKPSAFIAKTQKACKPEELK
ncbi:MAG TPA: hypothetical protein PLK08_10385, partial [Phycisphaerae bacterium]|nr:hypothetical protein [Phycisphaerae bacterium]